MSDTNGSNNAEKNGHKPKQEPTAIKTRAIILEEALAKKKGLFIKALASNGGIVTKACKAAKLDRTKAYEQFTADPEFCKAWLEALEQAYDALHTAAIERATKGSEKIVSYPNGDKVVTREVSDTLLIFLMKQGEAQKKWRGRIVQTGNIALACISRIGPELGLTVEQMTTIQDAMQEDFATISLL